MHTRDFGRPLARCLLCVGLLLSANATRVGAAPRPLPGPPTAIDIARTKIAEGAERDAVLLDLQAALPAAQTQESRDAVQKQIAALQKALADEAERKTLPADSNEALVLDMIEAKNYGDIWLHGPKFYTRNVGDAPDARQDAAIAEVLARGEAAMPALIARLDYPAPTRILMKSNFWTQEEFLLPLSSVCLWIIEDTTGCFFDLEADGRGKEHAAKWWRETAHLSRVERLKWQFPHAGNIGREFMFRHLQEAGQDTFLRVELRKKADWLRDPGAAQLLFDLGETASFVEAQAALASPIKTPESKTTAVLYMASYGGREQFEILARLVKKAALTVNAKPEFGLNGQIFLNASYSKRAGVELIFEAFLDNKNSMEGQHWISTQPHQDTLRWCDGAMFLLATKGRTKAFDINWPTPQRDAAIALYKRQNHLD